MDDTSIQEEYIIPLIGMMLAKNETIHGILPQLNQFCSDSKCRIILAVIDEFSNSHRGINANLLATELLKRGKLKELGGPQKAKDFLFACAASALSDESIVKSYLLSIEKDFRLRNVLAIAQNITQQSVDPEADPNKIEAYVRSALNKNTNYVGNTSIQTGEQLFEKYFPILEAQQEGTEKVPTLTTTFDRIDHIMNGGFRLGYASVIAGPSNGGKTTIADQIVAYHALVEGTDGLIITPEMTPEQKFDKLFSRLFNVSLDRVLTATIPSNDNEYSSKEKQYKPYTWPDIQEIVKSKSKTEHFDRIKHIHMFCQGNMSITSATNAMYKTKADLEAQGRQLKLVVIDYIQLIAGDTSYANFEREVNDNTRKLIGVAKDLGVHILILSQINEDGKVRDSRAIYMHTDSQIYIEPQPNSRARLFVQKGRMHRKESNAIDLEFVGALGIYRELEVVEETDDVETLKDVLGL